MNSWDLSLRQAIVRCVVDAYVCHYTCGEMADSLADCISEKKEAVEWFLKQKKIFALTKEEMDSAIKYVENERRERGTACIYDGSVFETVQDDLEKAIKEQGGLDV